MKFADLGLSDELLQAVDAAGYTEPTPIQAEAIPPFLMMKDVLGIAQTGTGKTASFVLPMIDVLSHGRRRARMPRSLILEPTRELAAQVAENFEKYGVNHDLKMALLIGGVQMGEQVKALEKGVDVLIATPGRLMDLFERGKILLTGCELLVIDEADRMLDMGFIPDIEFICDKLPTTRQTMLFSATMPPAIERLAKKFLDNPKRIEVSRAASTNDNIQQNKVMVAPRKKQDVLRSLLREEDVTTAIVFSNRKTTVRDLAKALNRDGFKAGEIHGDIDQNTRNAELQRFKDGVINILVASDVAARGLDIKGVSHVFNYDTPWHPDDYVHRIGRTGRAGAKGKAFTFVTPADAEAIDNVEKLTGMVIPVYSMDSGTRAEPKGRKPKDDKAEAAKTEKPKSDKPKSERPKRDRTRKEKPTEVASEQREAAPAKQEPERAEPKQEAVKAEKPEKAAAPKPASKDDGEWNGPVPGFLDVSAT
ncbi:DEAD/DEAH box helicase [Altererythrobacter sp. ZODW24]|uniref:DEAD/DEAH box helicase n=1 Tax=Altererythrobacter sp. ZODW24 TaxID=2185142 RepID=UPI000DF82BA5|nr:DEAD/DEAH box helicase [Altererythrobacter sp. ZODW24]